jgi:XTP/dITP diphosphohydrolase
MRVLVATRNTGKRREYAEMLGGMDAEFVSLDDIGLNSAVAETGDTFEANAVLKAHAYAEISGMLTLADDSGLEVDALDGGPGVLSARYGGPGATDLDRVHRLLDALRETPPAQRAARFRCVIAVCTPTGNLHITSGAVEGSIAFEPRGEHGFGYDPVFEVEGYGGATMAELPPHEKNRISHRGRALEAMRPILAGLIGQGGAD